MPPGTILLIGAEGQVGWELRRALSPLGQVVALDHPDVDLANPDSIRRKVREIEPTLIVNAAAYTAVDKAEAERDVASPTESPGNLTYSWPSSRHHVLYRTALRYPDSDAGGVPRVGGASPDRRALIPGDWSNMHAGSKSSFDFIRLKRTRSARYYRCKRIPTDPAPGPTPQCLRRAASPWADEVVVQPPARVSTVNNSPNRVSIKSPRRLQS